VAQSRRFRTAVALAALAVLAAGCGDSDDSKTTSAAPLTALGQKLPPSVAEGRTLDVGSDIAYAPVEFFVEGTQTATGIDVDICNAVVAKFGEGFTCRFMNTTFDGIIPSLQSKRFDVIMSSMSDCSAALRISAAFTSRPMAFHSLIR